MEILPQPFSPELSSSLYHHVFPLQACYITASHHVFLGHTPFLRQKGITKQCQAVILFRGFCWDRHGKIHIRDLAKPLSPLSTSRLAVFSVLLFNPAVTQQDIWIFPLITYKLCNMTAVLQVGISYIVIKYDQFTAGAMADRG